MWGILSVRALIDIFVPHSLDAESPGPTGPAIPAPSVDVRDDVVRESYNNDKGDCLNRQTGEYVDIFLQRLSFCDKSIHGGMWP